MNNLKEALQRTNEAMTPLAKSIDDHLKMAMTAVNTLKDKGDTKDKKECVMVLTNHKIDPSKWGL